MRILLKILLGFITLWSVVVFFNYTRSKRKAEQGNPEEQYRLGCMYGDLGKYNLAEKYLKLASEQGFKRAQARLGILYGCLGKSELAEKYLLLGREEYPETNLILGALYNEQGKYDLAKKYV